MSVTKKKIKLIAEEIRFNKFSISYIVRLEEDVSGVVVAKEDIWKKDLTMNPAFIDKENREVHFITGNVTPSFYQAILSGTIRNRAEYINEKDSIYLKDDVIGYVICD